MTDPNAPPYTLPPIDVVGQRRRPSGLFPAGPGGGGGGNNPGGVNQWELDEEGDPPPPPEGEGSHPCDDPETALDWNADAAAAEAKKEFERLAAARGDTELYSREWHAFIYEDQNGRMYLGPIVAGTINSVTPETAGMTPNNLVGFIHNHPGGGLNPSGDDWIGFDNLYEWVAQWSSGGTARADQLRQYIVARDTSDPNSPMAIRVFNKNSSRSSDAPAPEVNPDGQPCP